MSRTIYFARECDTCGRNLRIRVEYLGKKILCQHCGAEFIACQPVPASEKSSACDEQDLLARAEELLQTAESSGIGLSNRVD